MSTLDHEVADLMLKMRQHRFHYSYQTDFLETMRTMRLASFPTSIRHHIL